MARRDYTDAGFERMCEEHDQERFDETVDEIDERLREKHGISRLKFLNSTRKYEDYLEELEMEKSRLYQSWKRYD